MKKAEIKNTKEFVERMVTSHKKRFGDEFWDLFDKWIRPSLPPNPVVVDLGTGPGLFLKDIDERLGKCVLYGYDEMPEMLEYAKKISYKDAETTFENKDFNAADFQFPKRRIDLIAMNFIFHDCEYPIPLLNKVMENLMPAGGVFLIYDWIRCSLQEYIEFYKSRAPEIDFEMLYTKFGEHNRYALGDLTWLLENNGFNIMEEKKLTSHIGILISRVKLIKQRGRKK